MSASANSSSALQELTVVNKPYGVCGMLIRARISRSPTNLGRVYYKCVDAGG